VRELWGRVGATARASKNKVRRYYICSARYKQGKTACPAKHLLPYEAITDLAFRASARGLDRAVD
jgi:hypothetical protein